MAILFPDEQVPPTKPDLETIESFDNSNIGGVEKFSTISTGAVSIGDVMPLSGGTFVGNVIFQNTEAQGDYLIAAINAGNDAVNFGDDSNYANFDTTGHLTFTGTAKPWEDLRIEPIARGTGANNPTFEQIADNAGLLDTGASRGIWLYMFSDETTANQKEMFFTMQMPHAWDGGSISIHVHWVGTVADTTSAPIWGLEYAWKEPGAVFGATATIVYTDGKNYTASGDDADITAGKHYISKFTAISPGTTADGISSILIGRLFRFSGDASDTYNAAGNKCGLLYIDAHYQISSIGSTDEYTK